MMMPPDRIGGIIACGAAETSLPLRETYQLMPAIEVTRITRQGE
jgi:hypothetical protein